jgi:hypothetical protein
LFDIARLLVLVFVSAKLSVRVLYAVAVVAGMSESIDKAPKHSLTRRTRGMIGVIAGVGSRMIDVLVVRAVLVQHSPQTRCVARLLQLTAALRRPSSIRPDRVDTGRALKAIYAAHASEASGVAHAHDAPLRPRPFHKLQLPVVDPWTPLSSPCSPLPSPSPRSPPSQAPSSTSTALIRLVNRPSASGYPVCC